MQNVRKKPKQSDHEVVVAGVGAVNGNGIQSRGMLCSIACSMLCSGAVRACHLCLPSVALEPKNAMDRSIDEEEDEGEDEDESRRMKKEKEDEDEDEN